MKKIFVILVILINSIFAQTKESEQIVKELISEDGLELVNVVIDTIDHNGKKGIQVSKASNYDKGETLVIISDLNFKKGTIEIELMGVPASDAAPQMRGFVGIAFHVNPNDYTSYECFYLRPLNARADSQLQRNHTTQYIVHPEYPWYKLRKENPGLYESYIDIVPEEWTKVKIEVEDKAAKLYLHDSEQPCLIVNELKGNKSESKIALWLHSSTVAHYRNLVVTSK